VKKVKACDVYTVHLILLQEPLCLGKCVISQGENEFHDFIEINEITSKNTYYIQVTMFSFLIQMQTLLFRSKFLLGYGISQPS